MKALVLGGTGFIGRRLVDYLLKEDCDVTIATSGNTKNQFGDEVATVTVDRFDLASMADKLSSPPYFDVIFDQLAFSPVDARNIIEIFKGRAGHYVLTSSGAVYEEKNGAKKEEDFDQKTYPVREDNVRNLGYSEGKRGAEAFLFQRAPFPVAAARFPIVIGHDDSTARFQNHVNRVQASDKFSIPGDCAKRNYVWVDDAGRFLAWLGLNRKVGPYNAATSYSLSAIELIERIGSVVGKEVNVDRNPISGSDSTYYNKLDSVLSTTKAENEGFRFTPFDEWFPVEVRKTLVNGGMSLNSSDYFRKLLSG